MVSSFCTGVGIIVYPLLPLCTQNLNHFLKIGRVVTITALLFTANDFAVF